MARADRREAETATGSTPKRPAASKRLRRARTRPRTEMVNAVLLQAEKQGLLKNKDGRITGRLSEKLIKAAKAQTGIESDTDLIEFALANIALEDNFSETFAALRGTVDPDIDLEF